MVDGGGHDVNGLGATLRVPARTREVLVALVPGEELEESHRGSSRNPGGLAHGWSVRSVAGVWQQIGFRPPRLSSLVREGMVEHLAIPDGAGVPAGGSDPAAMAAYLPQHLRWEKAQWMSVVADGATVMWWASHHRGSWPAPSSSRGTVGRDDRGEDFALVEVGGVAVGVQAGRRGTCEVSWTIHRGPVAVDVSVWTPRDPLSAVNLVVADGVLT